VITFAFGDTLGVSNILGFDDTLDFGTRVHSRLRLHSRLQPHSHSRRQLRLHSRLQHEVTRGYSTVDQATLSASSRGRHSRLHIAVNTRGRHSRLHLAVVTFAVGCTLGFSNILGFGLALDFGYTLGFGDTLGFSTRSVHSRLGYTLGVITWSPLSASARGQHTLSFSSRSVLST